MIALRQGGLDDERVHALLRLHLAGMHAASPPGSVYALDLSGLQVPEVTFWSAWDGDTLLGVGALKDLGDRTGEVKSMRTAPAALRRGVAAALLDAMLAAARARGWVRLLLETGTGPAFAAANALYARYGFVPAAPFGGYTPSDFNRFFSRDL